MTNKIMTRLGTGLVTVALLGTSVVPAFATTNVNVSGNGKNSTNNVNVNMSNTTVVSQQSNTLVENNVLISQNSGGNTVKGNKKGGSITTGDTNANVNTTVIGGSNDLTLPNCGCDTTTNVNVSKNGKKSNTNVNVNYANTLVLGQTSDTTLFNFVGLDQSTGNNKVKNGKGGSITTGDTNANVNTVVEGGTNSAM